MEKLVSVAIVNWNGEKYLYKCIKSLLEQNYKSIEVIIIDNDSTDNSVKIIEDNFKEDVILHLPFPVIKSFLPNLCCFSRRITSAPLSAAVAAAIIPAGPPPITTTFFK